MGEFYTDWSGRLDRAETEDDLREVRDFLESRIADQLSEHEYRTLHGKWFRRYQQITGAGVA